MLKAAILGCGYVGTAVARCWSSRGMQVTATTTTPERVNDLRAVAGQVKVVHGADLDSVSALLSHQHVLLVSVAGGRRAGYEAVYLNTAKTIVAALEQTSGPGQIIYTSSFSVYGDHQGHWVTEDDPVKPANDNAQILAETEQTLLAAASPNRRVCILRLGGIYGPNRELHKIYSRAAGSTRSGEGGEGSNWIHLDDIVGAIDFAQQNALDGIFNVVQDEIPTVRELIDRVCRAHDLPAVTWDPSQPSSRPYNVRVSNQKLKSAGYQFQHPTFEL